MHDEVTTYVTSPTYQTHCADEVKYAVSDKLTAALKTKYGAENVIDINGARVEFEDGWGLVRASSNLPVLVLVFEGKQRSAWIKSSPNSRTCSKDTPRSERWRRNSPYNYNKNTKILLTKDEFRCIHSMVLSAFLTQDLAVSRS